MRILLVAASLLVPLAAVAQVESDIREAAGKIKKSLAEAQAARPAPYACPPETPADPKLYSSDVRWGLSLPELLELYEKLYASDKRLPHRAYFNAAEGRFELPNAPERGGPVVISELTVKALVRHIEAAFEKDYIDAVFFPDMGHSHLLIPETLYASKYSKYPTARQSQFYGDVLADPQVRIFYHTAEQLKSLNADRTVIDDDRVRWRHKTRNIAGPISQTAELTVYQNPSSPANTVGDVPGFYWWGAGFSFSANKNGCFSFTRGGKSVRFDVSLRDLEPDPANPVTD